MVYVMRNLNGWVGDRMREGITSAFRVPGERGNVGRGVDLCAKIEVVHKQSIIQTPHCT